MNSRARFSIITPTLNAERYLADCLASVKAQMGGTVDHLVVDGGSSDGTEAIVRASGASLLSLPGIGQTAAINAGMRLASADIVAWLNADDVYLPEALTYVSDHFRRDGMADVVYGDCEVIGPHDELLWHQRPGAYDFSRLLRHGNYLAQPAVFFRRHVFDAVGFLDERLNYGMDFELWLRLRNQQLRYIPRTLAAFRWHKDSKTASSNLANWRECVGIVRQYGGGWTPHLLWSFARARVTIARQGTLRVLKGSAGVAGSG